MAVNFLPFKLHRNVAFAYSQSSIQLAYYLCCVVIATASGTVLKSTLLFQMYLLMITIEGCDLLNCHHKVKLSRNVCAVIPAIHIINYYCFLLLGLLAVLLHLFKKHP